MEDRCFFAVPDFPRKLRDQLKAYAFMKGMTMKDCVEGIVTRFIRESREAEDKERKKRS